MAPLFSGRPQVGCGWSCTKGCIDYAPLPADLLSRGTAPAALQYSPQSPRLVFAEQLGSRASTVLSPRYSPNRKQSPKIISRCAECTDYEAAANEREQHGRFHAVDRWLVVNGHRHIRGLSYRKNYELPFRNFGQAGDVHSNPSRLILAQQLVARSVKSREPRPEVQFGRGS